MHRMRIGGHGAAAGLALAGLLATAAMATNFAGAAEFRLNYIPSKDNNYVCLDADGAEAALEAFRAVYSADEHARDRKAVKALADTFDKDAGTGCALLTAHYVPALPLEVIEHGDAGADWGERGKTHYFLAAEIRLYNENDGSWVPNGDGFVLVSSAVVSTD